MARIWQDAGGGWVAELADETGQVMAQVALFDPLQGPQRSKTMGEFRIDDLKRPPAALYKTGRKTHLVDKQNRPVCRELHLKNDAFEAEGYNLRSTTFRGLVDRR